MSWIWIMQVALTWSIVWLPSAIRAYRDMQYSVRVLVRKRVHNLYRLVWQPGHGTRASLARAVEWDRDDEPAGARARGLARASDSDLLGERDQRECGKQLCSAVDTERERSASELARTAHAQRRTLQHPARGEPLQAAAPRMHVHQLSCFRFTLIRSNARVGSSLWDPCP